MQSFFIGYFEGLFASIRLFAKHLHLQNTREKNEETSRFLRFEFQNDVSPMKKEIASMILILLYPLPRQRTTIFSSPRDITFPSKREYETHIEVKNTIRNL